MWAWLRFRGETSTIDEITQACVRIADQFTSFPRAEYFEQYRIAVNRYQHHLRALFPAATTEPGIH
jgi:hypothetical protein